MQSTPQRRLPSLLRGGAAGLAVANSGRLSQSCNRLVQQSAQRVLAGDEGQRHRICLQGVREGLPHTGSQTHLQQALYALRAPNERKAERLIQTLQKRLASPELGETNLLAASISSNL